MNISVCKAHKFTSAIIPVVERSKKAITIVVKLFLKALRLASITVAVSIILTACTRSIFVPAIKQPDIHINQKQSTSRQPAKFYVCGNSGYPCLSTTVKWQASVSTHGLKLNHALKNQCDLDINHSKENHNAKQKNIRSCLVKN